MNDLIFPKGFLFGSATAAYQIEGAFDQDGRGLSVWDSFVRQKGKIQNGDTGDSACNTYQNPLEDIEIQKELGLNAYRFSISWPRVLPQGKGKVNQKGLDYYKGLVDMLLERGITPFVTLFHWDTPLALFDEYKGFASRQCAYDFADYGELMVRKMGDRVKHWITINEPWEHAAMGHLLGEHAPGISNPWLYMKTAHHLLLGHGLAMERIRSIAPDAQAGITLSQTPVFPRTPHPKDIQAAALANQFFNQFYLDGLFKGQYPDPFWRKTRMLHPRIEADDMKVISAPTDFLGLNYYSREYASYKWYVPFLNFWIETEKPAEDGYEQNGKDYTAMGWEVYPQGLYDLLKHVHEEYDQPTLYITENGAAYGDQVVDGKVQDEKRIDYLQKHFAAALQAMQEGVDLRGYFLWSLMDNFEWAYGFSKRFGLVHVDHQTQKRTIKQSAYWLKDLIKKQGKSPH